nr:hypothetical protein [Streptomyces antibioticus]
MYENADPFHIAEPSGVLDTTNATYETVDEQTVRVRGARYVPADDYTSLALLLASVPSEHRTRATRNWAAGPAQPR